MAPPHRTTCRTVHFRPRPSPVTALPHLTAAGNVPPEQLTTGHASCRQAAQPGRAARRGGEGGVSVRPGRGRTRHAEPVALLLRGLRHTRPARAWSWLRDTAAPVTQPVHAASPCR